MQGTPSEVKHACAMVCDALASIGVTRVYITIDGSDVSLCVSNDAERKMIADHFGLTDTRYHSEPVIAVTSGMWCDIPIRVFNTADLASLEEVFSGN